MNLRVWVFGERPGSRYRAGRTLRALQGCGWAGEDLCGATPAELLGRLTEVSGPLWLVRAGCWPAGRVPLRAPPPSHTGRPLAALGAVLGAMSPAVAGAAEPAQTDDESGQWDRLWRETGGAFSAHSGLAARLPPLVSVFLEAPLVAHLAERLAAGQTLTSAVASVLTRPEPRLVHFAPLDVQDDPALRVVQLVTSLQQGGAERVARDLHVTLYEHGCRSQLVTLGRPTRAALAVPPGMVDLARHSPSRRQRVAAAGQAALDFAADLLHAHLLNADDIAELGFCGVPLLLTIHNVRAGWPDGMAELPAHAAALLVACSQTVEAELAAAGLPLARRTVWNGVDFSPLEPTPALQAAGREWRQQHGLGPDDFVLLTLANPRPQKRLEWLPAILAATRAEFARRGIAREARLVIAGEPSQASPAAQQAAADLRAAVCAHQVAEHVRLLDAVAEVAPLLAGADGLVACSRYEGLSLAQLEALAAGRPLVATAVGGTAELAVHNPAVTLLPPDAGPEQFARALADLAQVPPPSGRAAAAVDFTRQRMAAGYARLYPRAIAAHRGGPRRRGLWLIANNFSTGGAQSSARRLLLGLAAAGVRVRAAVLQEQEAYPTPGRRALLAAGIPVLTLPPVGTVTAEAAIAVLLEQLDADPPEAVVLWNAIASYKLLLADGLLDLPLFDISPGEMYFDSLEKYFQRPRPGLPYRSPREYGARLAGVIVKYAAEAGQAAQTLGAPVHVIPNGVPLPDLPAPRRGFDRLVLGTAARISPQKKLEELLAAVRLAHERLPPYVLRIAGGVETGAERYAEQVHRAAAGLPVEWLGELAEPGLFFQGLDLFAMISEPAGCPNASLEALAAGLPVVATDVGGASEQVLAGVTGELTPRGDPAAFAAALLRLAHDPELRSRYGAAGRAHVAARFSLEQMVQGYRRVLLASDAERGVDLKFEI